MAAHFHGFDPERIAILGHRPPRDPDAALLEQLGQPVGADMGHVADEAEAGLARRRDEQPAILATAEGGTIIFFSMATSFAAAALGAEGLAADVRMLVGNGYVPGHAAYALELIRRDGDVRELFEARV